MPSGTSNRGPNPPSLEDIYTNNKTGGLTVVFQEWDRQFSQWDKDSQFIADQEQPALPGGGSGSLMTPAQQAARNAVTTSDHRFGWARSVRDDVGAVNLYDGSGWPIAIQYVPGEFNGWRVEVSYRIPPVDTVILPGGFPNFRSWPIPEGIKARLDTVTIEQIDIALLNPVLRVTLIPYTENKFLTQLMFPRSSPPITVIPTGPPRVIIAGSLAQAGYVYSLNDRESGNPVPITRIYAELV